jgi:formylglycine-generating enzyme required for sulfatase activity
LTLVLASSAHQTAKAQEAVQFFFLRPAYEPVPIVPKKPAQAHAKTEAVKPVAAAPAAAKPVAAAPFTIKEEPKKTAAAPTSPQADPSLAGQPLDPKWPKQLFVVVDSVLLGAKPNVIKALPDWQVTFVGRPALMIPKAIEELRQRPGQFGPVAVVGLGYNSLWEKNRKNFQNWADKFDKSVEDMLALLKERGVHKVVWVLLRELSPEYLPSAQIAAFQNSQYGWYFPYVNERLRAIKERHPEMALADWTSASKRPGITYDAIHVNPLGGELMAAVVKTAIGADVPAAPPAMVAAAGPAVPIPPAPPPAAKEADQKRAEDVKRSEDQKRTDDNRQADKDQSRVIAQTVEQSAGPAAETPSAAADGERANYAFRDCANCPEMVVLPAGRFLMGTPKGDPEANDNEGPQRPVTIARPFAVSKFEVTFAEWEACVAAGDCQSNPSPSDEGWGKGNQPVVNVSWYDAQEYVAWLSRTTGKTYRLLTEAEWEYAARAGTATPYSTGTDITPDQANFQTTLNEANNGAVVTRYRQQAIPVGSFAPNKWGLHDVYGNVWEWVQDNWHDDYTAAPANGLAWPGGDNTARVLRGGSWYSMKPDIRSATRHKEMPDYRSGEIGFRLARTL